MIYYVVSETPAEVCFTLLSTSEDVAEEWAEELVKYSDYEVFADVRETKEPFPIKAGDTVAILICADDDEIGIYQTVYDAKTVAIEDALAEWQVVEYVVGSQTPLHVMIPLQ